jgi:hypothetical protein
MTWTKRRGSNRALAGWAGTLALALMLTCLTQASAVAQDPSCGDKKASAAANQPLPEPAPGTAPVYACDNATIKMDDLWSGKEIVPVWVVRNTGTGDLSIKIKAG